MNTSAHREADYRADIDGLRALAVVPVLLFHAEVPGFSGGFVGVDIFFVISGYLITRIILRDLAGGRFSMATFIERRVRRILPALYVVMAACIVPAWFLMLADDFENFGQSLFATSVSANNVLLWLTSGYWGIATDFKPLLHTWSLGVEEQAYLGYPVLDFLRISPSGPPSHLANLAGIAFAIPLAWASWRWVEQPFRDRKRLSKGALFAWAACLGGFLGGVGLLIDSEDGFPRRVPGYVSEGGGGRRVTREMYVDRIYEYMDRPFEDPSKPHVLVLGNSFGRDFINCAIENGYMQHVETCYLPVNNRGDFGCFAGIDGISPRIRARLARADIVILVQGDVPTFNTCCWERDLELLRSAGAKRVVLVGTKNFGWNSNAIMCMGEEARRTYRPRVKDEVWNWNEEDRRNVPADSFVDLLGMLSDAGRTVPLFTVGGEVMSEDGRHFTKPGAKFVGELLFRHPALQDLRQDGQPAAT